MTRMQYSAWATQACRRLADLVMPRVCAGCGETVHDTPGGELCAPCWRELAAVVGGNYCRSCGDEPGSHLLIDGRCTSCRMGRKRSRFEQFVRVGHYDGALRALVLRFKHDFRLDRFLGRLLADAIQGRFDPTTVDIWVPVPSHWRQRLSRGFQPTALLARAAVRQWGGRVEPVLAMTRYVRPFHWSDAPQSASLRTKAIRGAFRARQAVSLTGQAVCVIDDVTTTGATLNEARRALRCGGAQRIFAAVVAKVSGGWTSLRSLDPQVAAD